ncbi:MAG TPA: hypothetical protein VGB37_09130 [Candidatus Lokiarchaeia archaeon]
MVLKALKELFTLKENRLILVLFLWLIIGFTLLKFKDFIAFPIGLFVFIPLLVICFILFIVALIFRREIRKSSWKQIVLYCIIAILIAIPFNFILPIIVHSVFVLALISYVFITAVFYMYGCYKISVDLDDKILNLSNPKKNVFRWIAFVGGTMVAILLLVSIYIFGLIWVRNWSETQQGFVKLALIILIIIIFLAMVGCLTLFKGNLNAWLGLFFIFISIFTLYLIVNIYYSIGLQEDTTTELVWMIVLYLLEVLLILYTTLTIIQTKAEVLSKIFKFIKTDAILMWLIFSKAIFEFAKEGIPVSTMNTRAFYSIAIFVLFIPLLLIAGIYGIWTRGKAMKKKTEATVSENKIE